MCRSHSGARPRRSERMPRCSSPTSCCPRSRWASEVELTAESVPSSRAGPYCRRRRPAPSVRRRGGVSVLLEAIGLVGRELADTPPSSAPGGPFTLACYMIEGRPSRQMTARRKALDVREPERGTTSCVASAMVSSLSASPGRAGADVVQVFDQLGRRSRSGGLPRVRAAARPPDLRRAGGCSHHPFRHRDERTARGAGRSGGDVVGVDRRSAARPNRARSGSRGRAGEPRRRAVASGWDANAPAAVTAVLEDCGRACRPHLQPGSRILPRPTRAARRLVDFVHELTSTVVRRDGATNVTATPVASC